MHKRHWLIVILCVLGSVAVGFPLRAGDAEDMQALVNGARTEVGLDPLSLNSLLSEAATRHAQDMLDRDYFDHTSPEGLRPADRALAVGYAYIAIGENIAGMIPDINRVFTMWMESEPHRNNIRGLYYREMGLGRVENTWVLLFGNSRTAPNTAPTAVPRGMPRPTPGFATMTYVIQEGDTFYLLAGRIGTSATVIERLNPEADPLRLVVGQVITVPANGFLPTVVPTVLPTLIPTRMMTPMTYVVQRGDTLYRIAQRYDVTVDAIVAANALANPDRLDVGQVLIIPAPEANP
jgi:LysM repeat protein